MIRQCAILFGCLAWVTDCFLYGYQVTFQHHRYAVAHPILEIGLD